MGGRLLDWLGAGDALDRPAAAAAVANVVPGSVAIYFAQDTNVLSLLNQVGPAWVEIDLGTIITSESIQDIVGAMFTDGSGITTSYDDGTGTILISCSITQYTDEMAQDAIGALLAAGADTGLTVVYDDGGNAITFAISDSYVNNLIDAQIDVRFVTMTQAAYDALGAYDPDTYYIIIG